MKFFIVIYQFSAPLAHTFYIIYVRDMIMPSITSLRSGPAHLLLNHSDQHEDMLSTTLLKDDVGDEEHV